MSGIKDQELQIGCQHVRAQIVLTINLTINGQKHTKKIKIGSQWIHNLRREVTLYGDKKT